MHGRKTSETLDQNRFVTVDPVSALLIQETFTGMVDYLRQPEYTPNPSTNELASLLWNLVSFRITPAVVMKVPTLAFTIMAIRGEMAGLVVCPPNWLAQVSADSAMQRGAMVFCASQARDYWNFKLPSKINYDDCVQRATMYEADYLRMLSRTDPAFKPNTYQESVLAKFPNGLSDDLIYTSFPVTREPMISIPGDGFEVFVAARPPVKF